MRFDHRRILATAIARLRAKLKYRPVVFELMPAEFTLTELQRTVEAISGRHLHKQNFRRLVETAALVEPTGETSTATGGRPAALFRFRREVLQERPAPGLRLGRTIVAAISPRVAGGYHDRLCCGGAAVEFLLLVGCGVLLLMVLKRVNAAHD